MKTRTPKVVPLKVPLDMLPIMARFFVGILEKGPQNPRVQPKRLQGWGFRVEGLNGSVV